MLTKKDIKNAIELDVAAARVGGYIDVKANTPSYRLRDMHQYCMTHNKDIERLTSAEREMFRVPPKTQVL